MNNDKPSKIVLFLTIILIIINLFFSYIFNGKNIAYALGNVFGFTMIVITISSFFPKYRNSRSRWLITLNTMIIAFMLIVGGGLAKKAKEVGYNTSTKFPIPQNK